MKTYLPAVLLMASFPFDVFAQNDPVLLYSEKATMGTNFTIGNGSTVQYLSPKTNNTVFKLVANHKTLTFTVPEANAIFMSQVGNKEDGLDLDNIAFCKEDNQNLVKILNLAQFGFAPSLNYNFQESHNNYYLVK
jgi:hypothetical protein